MAAVIKIEVNTTATGGAVQQVTKDLREMDGAARNAGGGFTVMGGAIASALGGAALGAITAASGAMAGFIGDSIGAAGAFEAGMQSFAAAAGNMGQEEVAQFKDLFLDLGKELPVSTQEVQDAAIALVKGGLDPAVVSAGALEDSLKFAAAAGMGLEEAAELGVKMLGTFVPITASAAEQTAFLAESQELLVKAANASTLNVDALGDAMLAAGGQARAAGLDYDDFVTTMGLISPAFGSAAEAGTSFKNFLLRLQPTTKDQIGLFHDLNLITEEGQNVFYDAQGGFLGMENAAEKLKVALGGLSEEERLKTMQILFGNDAMGAASALAEGGAEAYRLFAEKMAESNGIAAQTAATQQGLNFAMDNAKGSVEALQIVIGTALLPILTDLVTNYLTPGINALTDFAEGFIGAKDKGAFLRDELTLLGERLAAWAQEAIPQMLANLADAAARLAGWVQESLPGWSEQLAQMGQRLAQWVMDNLPTLIANLMDARNAMVQWVLDSLPGWAEQLAQLGQKLLQWVIDALPGLGTNLGQITALLLEKTGEFIAETGPKLLELAERFVLWVAEEVLPNLPGTLADIGAALLTAIGNFLTEVAPELGKLAESFINWVQEDVLPNLPGKLAEIGTAIADGIKGFAESVAAEAAAVGTAIADGIAQAIQDGVGAIIAAAKQAAADALNAAKKALGIASPSAVFAAEVGAPIAQGMALGMLQAAPVAASAAAGMAGATVNAARSTVLNRTVNVTQNITNGAAGFRQDAAIVRALGATI